MRQNFKLRIVHRVRDTRHHSGLSHPSEHLKQHGRLGISDYVVELFNVRILGCQLFGSTLSLMF